MSGTNDGSSFPPPPPGSGLPPVGAPAGPGLTPEPKASWWKRKLWKLPVWGWIVIVLVVAAAAGSGGGKSDDDAADDTQVESTDAGPTDTTSDETVAVTTEPATEATEPAVSEAPTTVEATTTEAPTTTEATVAANIRELDDGAALRLNTFADNAPAPNQFVSPDPGGRFSSADVELCAGDEPLSVNPLNFSANTATNRVIQLALGAQTLQTYELAPNACTRGIVMFSIPVEETMQDLVYSDLFTEAARIPVTAAVAPQAPLAQTEPPAAQAIGAKIDMGSAGAATVYAVTPGVAPNQFVTLPEGATLTSVDVELCATTESVSVNPLNFFGTLSDNTMLSTELGGVDGQLATIEVAPGTCVRGNVSYAVPAGLTLRWVSYAAYIGSETARWQVG